MALVSEGWETPQRLAARVKLRSSQSARKVADLLHLHVPPRGINRASRPRLPLAPASKSH